MFVAHNNFGIVYFFCYHNNLIEKVCLQHRTKTNKQKIVNKNNKCDGEKKRERYKFSYCDNLTKVLYLHGVDAGPKKDAECTSG